MGSDERSHAYGENCVELGDTILIGQLNTSEPGFVQDGDIVRVAIAAVIGTGVNTSSITVEYLVKGTDDRLTSTGIKNLEIVMYGDAFHIFSEVGANVFTGNICIF